MTLSTIVITIAAAFTALLSFPFVGAVVASAVPIDPVPVEGVQRSRLRFHSSTALSSSPLPDMTNRAIPVDSISEVDIVEA